MKKRTKKKRVRKSKLEQFMSGGSHIRGYIENPNVELQKGDQMLAQANYEGATNPWAIGLNALGQGAMAYGTSMGGFGEGAAGQAANNLLPMLSQFKTGGSAKNSKINIEGGEVVETPDGQLAQAKGPSHANGGIDVDLPQGGDIYSARVKKEGESMAKRKIAREKRKAKLEKMLSNDDSFLAKNAYKRGVESIEKEEAEDMNIQNALHEASGNTEETRAYGGTWPPGGYGRKYRNPDVKLPNIYADPNIPFLEDQSVENNVNMGPHDMPKGNSPIFKDGYANLFTDNQSPFATSINNNDLPLSGEEIDYSDVGRSGTNSGTDNTKRTREQIPLADVPHVPLSSESLMKKLKGYNSPSASKLSGTGLTNKSITLPKTANAPGGSSKKSTFGLGDAITMGSNVLGSVLPYINNEEQRAATDPNINHYEDFGQEGLKAIDRQKGSVDQIADEELRMTNLLRNSALQRNRNSARGINTKRALDLSTDGQILNRQNQIQINKNKRYADIYNQEKNQYNLIDDKVMTGEAARDLADRKDDDNYYTNKNASLLNLAEGISYLGDNINNVKENDAKLNSLNQRSAYGIETDVDGTIGNNLKKSITTPPLPEKTKTPAEQTVKKESKVPETPSFKESEYLEELGQKESNSDYNAVNKNTGAVGKYQFVPKWHSQAIKDELGIDMEEFKNNPEAQEKYMKSQIPKYKKNVDKYKSKIRTNFPELTEKDLMKLAHYQPALLKKLADNSVDLEHEPGKKGTNQSLRKYLNLA